MKYVLKAFDKNGNEVDYAVQPTDFTCRIPEGFTLKKLPTKNVSPEGFLCGEDDCEGRLMSDGVCSVCGKHYEPTSR